MKTPKRQGPPRIMYQLETTEILHFHFIDLFYDEVLLTKLLLPTRAISGMKNFKWKHAETQY